MKETIQEDMGVEVSMTMVKRAKVKVIRKVMDARSGEYSRPFDYALELKRSEASPHKRRLKCDTNISSRRLITHLLQQMVHHRTTLCGNGQ